MNIDPQLFQEVFVELFANAFRHDRGKGALVARARIGDGRFLFGLHEPKTVFPSDTQNWGREPLRNIRQRHYGLGLNRVRYHRSARRRVAGSIRSQSRGICFDNGTPGVEPASEHG